MSNTTTSQKLAPYNQGGDLLAFPASRYHWDAETRRSTVIDETVWRPVAPFAARLQVLGYERGQSAARLIWTDELGHRYPMFLSDAAATLATLSMLRGRTSYRWWIVVKRGQNYGIRPANDSEIAAAEASA